MKSYCYSNNEENFYGDYATPEAAAMDGMGVRKTAEVWVGEQRAPDMSCPIDGDDLIYSLTETEDFAIEAAENFDVSNAARIDLTARLNAMWDAWVKENNITPDFYRVDNVTKWTLQFQNENGEPEEDMSERGRIVAVQVTKA